MKSPNIITRRSFLGKSACSAMGMGGTLNALLHLRAVHAAATPDPGEDYKALVCLYLVGGNDADSVIVPTSQADYTAYNDRRQHLAIPNAGEPNGLLPIHLATADPQGRTFGINPAIPEIQSLFNDGDLAFVGNVGTLVKPITRTDVMSGDNVTRRTDAVPGQLFSHADQSTLWQNSAPSLTQSTGWGGRLADLINSTNGNAELSMSVSLAGNNTFQVGREISQYHVTPRGSVSFSDYEPTENDDTSSRRSRALDSLYEVAHGNLMANQYSHMMSRSIRNDKLVSAALSDPISNVTTEFPDTNIGRQLNMIARLIATRQRLGLKRQTFFCEAMGFDTHGDTLALYNTRITPVAQALQAFQLCMTELGIEDKVTTFTASEFGRTFTHNGVGTDHGWGSTQMILGGAVQGGDIYGQMHGYQINQDDDTSNGRWIPSTSVDQYSATLARWFGVSDSNLDQIFPNIGAFDQANLGFMA